MANRLRQIEQQFANPTRFMAWSRTAMSIIAVAAALLLAIGLYQAFFVAPEDYQQGHTVKIMFIHVPSAWLAMMTYGIVAFSSFGYLVFRHPLADVSAKAAVPIGAAFTFMALVTGSLWGKPMWGTYWVWDARLTSVLILFFMFLGLMALRSSLDDELLAGKLTAVLSIVGVIILPFIKISVEGLSIPWLGIELPSWNTLHQPSSVMRSDGPKIHASILWPLLICASGFTLMFFAMHLKAMRNEIKRRRLMSLMQAEVARSRQREQNQPSPVETASPSSTS